MVTQRYCAHTPILLVLYLAKNAFLGLLCVSTACLIANFCFVHTVIHPWEGHICLQGMHKCFIHQCAGNSDYVKWDTTAVWPQPLHPIWHQCGYGCMPPHEPAPTQMSYWTSWNTCMHLTTAIWMRPYEMTPFVSFFVYLLLDMCNFVSEFHFSSNN